MNPASDDRILGEYLLKEVVFESPTIRRWLAEQVSVSRRVLVDELRSKQAVDRDSFLEEVRAKAAVEHPLIGSVFEAVAEPELCFFAHELLPGATLQARLEAGEPFKPARLAHVLLRISEAHLHHEALGQATSPLALEHVHLDDHGVIRLDNLAIGGTRLPDQSRRDIVHFGETLPALVADSQPGTSRMLTLLGWMRGEGIEAPITWFQVRDFCTQIEQQLTNPASTVAPTQAVASVRKKNPAPLIAVACGLSLLCLIGLIALIPRMRSKNHPPPPACPNPPNAILIPAGKHPTPDGTNEELRAYRVAAQEVTIGQYAAFIETLDTLAKDHRERTFDHEDQPREKTSHLPDDWAALLAAAKNNSSWRGLPVTLDCPVVGVDWWDGSAYAEWKHARLPTQEEWFAALRKDVPTPSSITPAGWIPVTANTTDRTPQGLVGMAGSVCEWTRRPAVNPTNPLGERKWLIIGGSFLKQGSNALTREWTDNRSLRRSDLGFRIVFDAN